MTSSQRVALVTGGSRGIGQAAAVELARRHYAVVTCGTSEKGLEETAATLAALGARFHTITADVGRREQVEGLVQHVAAEFGRIDLLVNNAAVAPLGPLESIADDEFDRCLAVNIAAVFHATRSAWPVLHRQGGGTIVNISSLAAIDPFPGFQIYGASKAWVNLFTKAIADEGRPHGIRAFALALGAVETRMLRSRFPEFPPAQALHPQDVARMVAALAEDAVRHASGSTITMKR